MLFLENVKDMARIAPDAVISLTAGEWVRHLEEYMSRAGAEVSSWIDTAEAKDILTGIPERTLRSWAEQWESEQIEGHRPAVRVRRKGKGRKNSPWLFAEEDCREFARARGLTPEPSEAAEGSAPDSPAGETGSPKGKDVTRAQSSPATGADTEPLASRVANALLQHGKAA